MTGKRAQLGSLGERLAGDYLIARGYQIRERNFRCREGEIDIIAEKDGSLAFIEVRTRRGTSMGTPEESITQRKRERMRSVAAAYLQSCLDSASLAVRIDVVAVHFLPDGRLLALNHIENAVSADEG